MNWLEALVGELQQETRFSHSCNICQCVKLQFKGESGGKTTVKQLQLQLLTRVADYDVLEQVRVGHGGRGPRELCERLASQNGTTKRKSALVVSENRRQ